jgi:hypothetical protein
MKIYVAISTLIFLLVAVLHLFRLIWQADVMFGAWHAPMWISIVGVIVFGALSFAGMRILWLARSYSLLR